MQWNWIFHSFVAYLSSLSPTAGRALPLLGATYKVASTLATLSPSPGSLVGASSPSFAARWLELCLSGCRVTAAQTYLSWSWPCLPGATPGRQVWLLLEAAAFARATRAPGVTTFDRMRSFLLALQQTSVLAVTMFHKLSCTDCHRWTQLRLVESEWVSPIFHQLPSFTTALGDGIWMGRCNLILPERLRI
jgi:hypothetical protein